MGKEKERCGGVRVKGETTHALVNTTAMYVCEWQSVAYNHHTQYIQWQDHFIVK